MKKGDWKIKIIGFGLAGLYAVSFFGYFYSQHISGFFSHATILALLFTGLFHILWKRECNQSQDELLKKYQITHYDFIQWLHDESVYKQENDSMNSDEMERKTSIQIERISVGKSNQNNNNNQIKTNVIIK